MLDDSGFPVWFGVLFALAALFIAAVFVVILVAIFRNARTLRSAGVDPMTVQSQLAVRYLAGPSAVPSSPSAQGAGRALEQRLAELDDLHGRGLITAEEKAAARTQLLGTL